MRRTFIRALIESANHNESVTLLTGDLGFRVVEEFENLHPRRFLNCGVAEQSMMSIAAGLAFAGRKVFAYSIVNFATFRALEQIRNDICYHELPVCVVAVGAGTMYGTLGYSHHGLEDLAVMRALPGVRIYCPADSLEVEASVAEILGNSGPSYLRLGREPERSVHSDAIDISSGVLEVRTGRDLTVLVTGSLVSTAVRAAEQLSREGLGIQVLSVPVIEPLAVERILALSESDRFVTVEDHVVAGGLGTALLEGLAGIGVQRRVVCLGYPRDRLKTNGSQDYLLKAAGLDFGGMVQRFRDTCAA